MHWLDRKFNIQTVIFLFALQMSMNAVEKMNVMIIQHAKIHLAATAVTAILDTVETDGTVQVCGGDKTTFYVMDDTCFSTDINECEVPGGDVLCDENADCQ